MRHSRARGWSCPGTPSGLLPGSGITQGAGDTLCHLRAGSGAPWDSSEVRARCTTLSAPVMTGAMAGGDWSHGSAPSGISACTSSFSRACWLTEVRPGSFLRCDLEEEKNNPSLFSQLKLILVQALRGIVFESRASSGDGVVFICLLEMFSWLEQPPRCGPGQAGSRGCVARATVNIIVLLPCLERSASPGVFQGVDAGLRRGFGKQIRCL